MAKSTVFAVPSSLSKKTRTQKQALEVVKAKKAVGVYRSSNYNTAKSRAYRINNGLIAGWRSVGEFHAEVLHDERKDEYIVLARAIPRRGK